MTTMTAPTSAKVDRDKGSPGRGRRLFDVSLWADWAALIGLVALLVLFTALDPSFLSTGNITGMLAAAAALLVLTVA